MSSDNWQFWIDRGGTFTDIVAMNPKKQIITHKLLSNNPEQYQDAAIQGIRDILGIGDNDSIPSNNISTIKMGTTVGTNALLEHKGEPTVFVTTKGFKDLLEIGYQNRPDIFALNIKKPEQLYNHVIEVDERYDSNGTELVGINERKVHDDLKTIFDLGIRSIAISFIHGYKYPDHELKVAEIARNIGYSQISVSHEISPLIKLVSRAETTVVDAYLSPILKEYINKIKSTLQQNNGSGSDLLFMQSNGGLVNADEFRGKDCILSGPAGGIVGAIRTSSLAGFDKIISFDMGGTSTDVAHYRGELERSFQTTISGIHLQSPMMKIDTIAAGGGSILHFDGEKLRVGPDSAGSDPGPACYRRDGPLTVTDCNLMLNKIIPDHFPHVFGQSADMPLDPEIVVQKFSAMTETVNRDSAKQYTPESLAEGFLDVAVENMANAIKNISVQRGYDVKEYTLCCFGGAGGQHACKVADTLGITQIFIHPYAGVLSAYGIGLADQREILKRSVEQIFSTSSLNEVVEMVSDMENEGRDKLIKTGVLEDRINTITKLHLKYKGSDTALLIDLPKTADIDHIISQFNSKHKQLFGFIQEDTPLMIETVSVEIIGRSENIEEKSYPAKRNSKCIPINRTEMYSNNKYHDTPVFLRTDLEPGTVIKGPSIIIENNSTLVIEPGWTGEITQYNHLTLTRTSSKQIKYDIDTTVDPVMLEIFNNRFMSIAEQMGYTLQNTAHSVNIKERHDFSCALFDQNGNLVANAPHIPVHIGSMSECVKALISTDEFKGKKGDVYLQNSPYNGGTHLPDITVITPVFDESDRIYAYVASRGHHADIGGKSPGSMPHDSTTIHEEGILIKGMRIVENGNFHKNDLMDTLSSTNYPARNPTQNIADIQAQIAANEKGIIELKKLVDSYSNKVVQAYMNHVQDNAENEVKKVIDTLNDGTFSYKLDDDSVICIKLIIDKIRRKAIIDLNDTTPQVPTNFNAPLAVCKAAVLYVFRTLVQTSIPLNDGCLRPIDIRVPKGSMLDPEYPAAVVAGNVETSQYIVDTLFGALGILAASQGTMNNFTFGNHQYQYYETVCGGAGAGKYFHGTDAVHTHMTNSRITDPEILELRYPIILEEFSIRENSGGPGKYNGGNGVTRKIRFLDKMSASILSSHRTYPPFGLYGGRSGMKGNNLVLRENGTLIQLCGNDSITMYPNDTFIIETPGGGAFGEK